MDTLTHDPFTFTRGSREPEVLIVGEAWGAEEEAARKPFVGGSGKELDRMLADAGLSHARVCFSNVISARPPGNDFTHFLYPNSEKVNGTRGIKSRPILDSGISTLYSLIERSRPRLLIAAGNWPLWALSDHASVATKKGYKLPAGITSWRGSQTYSREIHGTRYPLLPIIHPASILREWSQRQITVHDLRRAERFLASNRADFWTAPNHTFIHSPSFTQVSEILWKWIEAAKGRPLELAVDVETYRRKWLSVVGLADENLSLCIPFFYVGKDKYITSYFSLDQEKTIFALLKQLLEHPNVKILGQNFIYDTEWLWRLYNINAIVSFDTMVAHHLLFPGTPKRLDYLASLYCDHYCYWKDESGDWDQFPEDHDRYWTYNCKDTRTTYECAQVLKHALKQQGMEELYAFQIEQWKISRELTLQGLNFNTTLQREMRLQLLEEASSLGQWLLNVVPDFCQYTSTGKPWYDSPKGTARLLYEVLCLSKVLHKKTKKPTTDDAALQELSEREPLLAPMLDRLRHLRSLGVFTSNFLDAKVSDDGRMRPSFNVAHPETFRWSSNKNAFGEGLNGQNIPKGDKDAGFFDTTEDEAGSSDGEDT